MWYCLYISLFVLVFLMTTAMFTQKTSIMISLISLELMMFLVLVGMMAFLFTYFSNMSYYAAMFCLAAISAALGLSLLVNCTRLYGSDMISNLFSEKNSRSSKLISLT